jgi:hypothetical protein
MTEPTPADVPDGASSSNARTTAPIGCVGAAA